ncbi:MAG TPA: hypothetical protein VK929_04195 [Longimicrobiales bacterium]|nr:hypothetical protein [Longimicrobiales bacterium]
MMGRKLVVAAVVVPHLLVAAILLTRMVLAALATQSPELGAQAVREIWIQTAILSVPGLLLLAGVAGLWRRRAWGWPAAAAADAILIALVAGDWLLGGRRVDHPLVLAMLAVLLLPLVVPQVRDSLHFAGKRSKPAHHA